MDLREFWKNQIKTSLKNFSKAEVETKFIASLLYYLGYQSSDWRQNFQVGEANIDFLIENKLANSNPEKQPAFFVLAKEPPNNLSPYLYQLEYFFRHLSNSGLKVNYGLITNGEELKIYSFNEHNSQIELKLSTQSIREENFLESIELLLKRTSAEEKNTLGAQVISLYTNKGGVGKTTTCLNLAAAFQEQNYKTLVIDLDAQSNLTLAAGIYPPVTQGRNIISLLNQTAYTDQSLKEHIWVNPNKNKLDLLPSNLDLYKVLNSETCSKEQIEIKKSILKEKIIEARTLNYDFIFLDLPASMGACYEVALEISDYFIAPTDLKPFSLYGLTHLIEELKDKTEILGLVINNLDLSINAPKAVSDLKKDFEANVFEQVIYNRNSLVTSTSLGKTIFRQREERKGNTASISALEYFRLSQEIISCLRGRNANLSYKPVQSNEKKLSFI